MQSQEISPLVEKIVYILGAGFSAPLGLPVMSNFMDKAKDQYFADPERFGYFEQVFEQIRRLSYIKNYYRTNLWNIEDSLSILEMEDQFGHLEGFESFIQFIAHVISFHTDVAFGSETTSDTLFPQFVINPLATTLKRYAAFIYTISGMLPIQPVIGGFHAFRTAPENRVREYSVITLNYDCVLEKMAALLPEKLYSRLYFVRPDTRPKGDHFAVNIAKLHGSVDTGDIVPPTWNKGFRNAQVVKDWKLAYQLLNNANRIRILGYSLPETDSYFKYLLRAAVVEAPNLKQIDVLCLDPDGTVQRRYDTFIDIRDKYRFRSESIEIYLREVMMKNLVYSDEEVRLISSDPNEKHEQFFTQWVAEQ